MRNRHYSLLMRSMCLSSAKTPREIFLGLLCLLSPALVWSSNIPYESADGLWCHVNTNSILPGSTGASIEIPRNDIYIVKRDAQTTGQDILRKKTFVKLSPADSTRFTDEIFAADVKSHFYLVRASAIYDSTTDFEPMLMLAAHLYQDTRTLNVYSFGLRNSGVKIKNLALVIKTPVPIRSENAICETAS